MNIASKIEQLEQANKQTEDDFARKWGEAYQAIADTMSDHEFDKVHAEIVSHLRRGNPLDTSRLSFVAARVHSLVERAARGFQVGLVMPPALAALWRAHDSRHADSAERHKASFDCVACAECGAEHPFLGRYEFSAAAQVFVIVNQDELITACAVCGGLVGRWNADKVISTASH
jgi:hypothetical protein